EKRAIEAAEAAISNPLLDDVSLKGARAALINITGGMDMTLYEVDEAANRIREEIDGDANIIFGSTFNESMQGTIRVSVVATGIDASDMDNDNATQAKNFNKPTQTQQANNF
ncbi:MAG: cell division protein FtsZ, partial [Flammeovirgaceae bacterium]